jgi:hypothetical protein
LKVQIEKEYNMAKALLLVCSLCFLSSHHGFQPQFFRQQKRLQLQSRNLDAVEGKGEDGSRFSSDRSRRSFVSSAGAAMSAAGFGLVFQEPAWAGIDVSGLRTDGGGGSLAEQLRAYDGSGAARVSQIKEMSSYSTSTPSASPVVATKNDNSSDEESDIATWAYRAAPGFNPRLSRAGPLGNLYRYDDQVVAPKSIKARTLSISFEFPADWLQLDKFLGGISYVDQRNGDKLYVLKTKLPEGERLATINKSFLGTSIFDPNGTIKKSVGAEIDDYKVASSTILNECPDNLCATRRRFKIKYATVTGNGLRVERRALVDAYEVSPEGDVIMMMTSSNAVKFDAKGSPQRETVEAIVDSFRIDI